MADILGKKDEFIEELKKKEDYGMSITKSWSSLWQENLRYFFSDQLHGKKLHKDWDWIIVNYIWPSAIQEICKLTRNNPKILVNPWEDSDTDFAEAWQSILQWVWEKGLKKGGMRIEQIRTLWDRKLFGYSISKIYWEHKPDGGWDDVKKEWVGDVKHKLWHPAEFWASDKEYIDEGDCGTVRYVDLDWAIYRWPDFKKDLKEQATSYKETISGGGEVIRGQISSAGTYPSAGRGGIDKGLGASEPSALLQLIIKSDRMSGQQTAQEQERKFVRISDQYIKDRTEEKETLDEDVPREELLRQGIILPINGSNISASTNKPLLPEEWPTRTVKKWNQPQYPYGRNIIRCNDVILNPDKKEQKYPYSRWPFIVIPHYLLPHMWQGTDAVQLYKTNQDMINVTVSHLVNNMKQFGDPRVAVERGAVDVPSGKQKSHFKIFSGAGSIIRLAKGAISGKRFMVIPPIPASASAAQLYQLFAQEYKNIVGLQDIAQGKKTEGEMTATQTQYLALSSNDRIYLQSVFEDEWVRQIAELAAEICQKNYDIGRFVRIVGEDKVIGATEITNKLKNVRMDIDVEPGQTLPFDEERVNKNYEKAFAMLQNPLANPMLPEMLRLYKISNWRKLLQKYEAWQLFYQFHQLFQAVMQKKITVEQGLQMLINAAKQKFGQQQQSVEGIAARNIEKGDFDKKQLEIDRQKGQLEVEKTIIEIKKQNQSKEKK